MAHIRVTDKYCGAHSTKTSHSSKSFSVSGGRWRLLRTSSRVWKEMRAATAGRERTHQLDERGDCGATVRATTRAM